MGGLPQLITYRFSILLAFLVLLTGSLLYANTIEPWMILVSRFLIGIFDGACPILLLSFTSHTANRIEKWRRQSKSHYSRQATRNGQLFSLKDKLFAVDLLNKGIVLPISLGKFLSGPYSYMVCIGYYYCRPVLGALTTLLG